MGRTLGFDRVVRAMQLGARCDALGITAAEALERAAEARDRRAAPPSRREVIAGAGAAAALGAMAAPGLGWANPNRPNIDVGVVGAGLAGLACADTLASAGVAATVYESRARIGGRQWSMGGAFAGPVDFPGQVVERGGELIDTTHLTMKAYAKRFKLKLEDVTKEWLPGEVTYHFAGRSVSEAEITDEFRDLAGRIRPDLAAMSNYIDAATFTAFDEQMDYTNLRAYLESRGAGPSILAALDVVYTIEYGRELELQSCLNLLFFMHIDRRSRFQPFGVFSDERYHVIGGNEQIAQGLAAGLPGSIELGLRLLRVGRLPDGRVELTFDDAGRTFTARHDAVVITLPYSVLRDVEFTTPISDQKRYVIDNLQYGYNTKLNVGFTRRVWGDYHSEGGSYSDLPNHQTTWEPNPIAATPGNAVLLDYSGGERARRLNPNNVDLETRRWLTDLEVMWGGSLAAAKKTAGNKYLAHMEHWPSDPNSKGSYTCNQPGYFTTMEGTVGAPEGNLYFCGEHTDPFYEWQGFMEGAANSGIRAAGELLADAKK